MKYCGDNWNENPFFQPNAIPQNQPVFGDLKLLVWSLTNETMCSSKLLSTLSIRCKIISSDINRIAMTSIDIGHFTNRSFQTEIVSYYELDDNSVEFVFTVEQKFAIFQSRLFK